MLPAGMMVGRKNWLNRGLTWLHKKLLAYLLFLCVCLQLGESYFRTITDPATGVIDICF